MSKIKNFIVKAAKAYFNSYSKVYSDTYYKYQYKY